MEPLRTHIDFETRSLVDLLKAGADAYARDPSTSPLMLTYGTAARGVRPVFSLIDFFDVPGYAQSIYPAIPKGTRSTFKVPCPQPILDAIARGDIFVAHNARFEQAIWWNICHLMWGWPWIPPERWSCTAARSRYFGIRASLEGSASDLEVYAQKDARGKQFINDFCKPRSYHGPKKGGIVKQLWFEPHEHPEGWAIGKAYCVSDGEAEADIDAVLPDLPDFEQRIWAWDFVINNRGVPIDVASVIRAGAFSDYFTAKAVNRFKQITDGLAPTQRDRVLEYLQQREEIENLGDLRSKTLKRLTVQDFPPDLREVISIRQECSLASVKKLDSMKLCTDDDGFARGIHLYGGAHTMRFSHKRIQTGNMKRGNKHAQKAMFRFLEGDWWSQAPAMPTGLLDDVQDAPWVAEAGIRFLRPLADLSNSMRGFVAAPKGMVIRAADYSQIEARVLAWLAREEWLLEAFRNNLDPYMKFAADYMYGLNYDDCFDYVNGKRTLKSQFGRQRQIAKSAVLGAGFGIGPPKFVEYCDNSDLIVDIETAQKTVSDYRNGHPNVVALWSRAERAAILAVNNPGEEFCLSGTGVKFYTWHIDQERFWLCMELPSGRCMHYYRPKVELRMKWGNWKETLTFRTEWNGKSYREDTYGGKLVENMVQATARDIMCVGGMNCEAAGYACIMLVHDEVVALTPVDFGSHEEMCTLLCTQEPWITDLPIAAEGATMERYGK